MNQTISSMKVHPQHLDRKALIYIRQSTLAQVRFHRESTERQYALQEKALSLGWTQDQIQLIDEDLGLSGGQGSKRQGFQRLVAQVSLGEVGAIFGLEVSRLARSSADLLRLLELCSIFDTIVVDEDGIYDLSDFNDRLILGFKGTMSEAELHFLRSRLIGGKKNKAHKGELRFPLPVGYCHDVDGNTVIDPDEEVQNAVRHIFTAFRATGSAYGVVQFFSQNHLRFPKRAYGGVWAGKLIWGTLTHGRVLGILYNPAYTGAYVFGRYKDRKQLDEQGLFVHRIVRLPKDQWEVLIHDHHPGYISWSEYEENLKQLQQNRTNAEVSGPAREGIALLQGIIVCGKCGRRMSVRYTGNGGIAPRYECKARWENGDRATCSSLRSEPVDQAIAARVLEAVQPAQLELALRSFDKVLSEEDKVETSWKLSLERAQYEVDRAQRQYDLAEPENRLVTRALEARWNEKMATLNQIREEYEHYCSSRAWRPTEQDKQDILSLAENLPRIWRATTTEIKDRKRILRLLIEDVTVFCEPGQADIRLGIRWRNQCHEVVHTTKPLPHHLARKHSMETIDRIRELARDMTDTQIAAHFNQSGYRTPEGKPFTTDSIQWLRYRYRIPGPSKQSNEWTVKEVALHFGVSTHVVYYWLNKGLLKATKIAPGWPWKIKLDEHTKRTLSDWISHSGHISKRSKT
ncbi:recombinase family protein [Fodinisporobacter ferrooxydans]|uniref:Recombinase family protein n=1 Tax=Fodinisporobacter ferrooxydans TaxID=2901836 RepID=A0ABY4CH57_9BACL|nr:recombinase family protein [Alicyclobacillaceae bacterium MYW30-H2]UOF91221.1 recombinase family protein [Alicyclobacillaceae bacterium MYW30-H2]UOF91696.1 recombinase family protein [Alicyclobacillaceae bacterium MYW30-H2]UOF92256.1 recombinase family protein [Alicyclobacillaceae bacterium MYW30-H2]